MIVRLASPKTAMHRRNPRLFSMAGPLCLAMVLCLSAPRPTLADPADGSPVIEVDQVIDVRAASAFDMFRFKPGLLRVPVGKRIRFLNMRGQHTVVSLRKMWPKDVPTIHLDNMSDSIIRFNKPGVYPLTCKVHGRHGMVMLVAVGDTFPNLEEAKAGIPGGMAGKRMRMLIDELEGTTSQ